LRNTNTAFKSSIDSFVRHTSFIIQNHEQLIQENSLYLY
jgi:hypothetical protein